LTEANDLQNAIDDAVAAFDAANLAWGQFYQHTWRRRPASDLLLAQPLRDALGDAALAVPQAADIAEAGSFLATLERARAAFEAFLALPQFAPAPGDINGLPDLLTEAIDLLRPWSSLGQRS
jgi:hypothetical protein